MSAGEGELVSTASDCGDAGNTTSAGRQAFQHDGGQNDLVQESFASPAPPLLHTLAQAGDVAKITELLDSDGAAANDRDPEGISALHWAAMNSHTSLCKLLLDRGAEVDAVGGELQATPLHWAARCV